MEELPVTYLSLKNEDNIQLEFDLISFREKGKQVKFLSINIKQGEEDEGKLINLDEDGFNRIQEFFKNLKWDF